MAEGAASRHDGRMDDLSAKRSGVVAGETEFRGLLDQGEFRFLFCMRRRMTCLTAHAEGSMHDLTCANLPVAFRAGAFGRPCRRREEKKGRTEQDGKEEKEPGLGFKHGGILYRSGPVDATKT